jgi:hypothetical protein
MFNHCPRTAVVLPDAYHSASIPDCFVELFGERRWEPIITTRNMEILTRYLLVEFNQQKQCGSGNGGNS